MPTPLVFVRCVARRRPITWASSPTSCSGHEEHEGHRAHGSDERGQGKEDHGGRSNTENDRRDRPDRGSTRYAQHVGLGERIPQKRLKDRPAHRETCAGQRREEHAREAQTRHDRPCGVTAVAPERGEHVGDRNPHWPDAQRGRDHEEKDDTQQSEPEGGGARAAYGASHQTLGCRTRASLSAA